jgi:hypothetical protein
VYVGWPTIKAIVGNKIAPRYADRYLARNGYEAQQTEEPVEPGRRDNLWEAVPGDHGAHGDFDERAKTFSALFWLRKNRNWLVLAGLALLAVASRARIGETGNRKTKS